MQERGGETLTHPGGGEALNAAKSSGFKGIQGRILGGEHCDGAFSFPDDWAIKDWVSHLDLHLDTPGT